MEHPFRKQRKELIEKLSAQQKVLKEEAQKLQKIATVRSKQIGMIAGIAAVSFVAVFYVLPMMMPKKKAVVVVKEKAEKKESFIAKLVREQAFKIASKFVNEQVESFFEKRKKDKTKDKK